MKLQSDIEKAWARVHDIYADILTEEEHAQFISTTNKIIAKLEK